MKKFLILLAITFNGFAFSLAHEGHDHVPGALPLDGFDQIQATDHLYLKLRVGKGDIQLQPFDHNNKPVPVKEVKIEGSVTFPKKTKSEKITFSVDGEAFGAKVNAKGLHRYTLEVSVTHQGKTEKAQFNVEPQ